MPSESVELVELYIAKYKGLQSLRVPWSSQVVLYGANGAGKSSVLEALALCCGSTATLWQIAAGAEVPRPGDLSCLLRSTAADLPLPPGLCVPSDGIPTGTDIDSNPVLASADFWIGLDADASSGRSWEDAVRTITPHAELAEFLASAGQRPLIRFGLERLEGLDRARSMDRGRWITDDLSVDDPDTVVFSRRFSRVLAVDGPVPGWLAAIAEQLPSQFAPLRRWLAEPEAARSPFADLLELPATRWIPMQSVWLASERTSSEAFYDLQAAYGRAEAPVVSLGIELDRLRFAKVDDESEPPADHPDARFWLVVSATEAIEATVRPVFPAIIPLAEDAHPGAIDFYRSPDMTIEGHVGRVDDPHLFDKLSSGERTWLDLALAHAAAKLEALGTAAYWLSIGISRLPDEALLEAAVDLEPELNVFAEDYWSAADLSVAVAYMQRLLGTAADVLIGELTDSESRAVLEAVYVEAMPAVREALRPNAFLQLYDEPERHLHPGAQRRVRGLLEQPESAARALATHSHLFLGGPGWQHLHLGRTHEGPVVDSFDPAHLNIGSAVVRQMGLTKGELLSRIRYALFVEGPVDVVVLRQLYGDLLDEAGVLLLPMYGVEEIASLTELELIGSIVDVGGGVLVDHAKTERLRAASLPRNATKEEQAIHELRRRLKARGRRLDFFGLDREDIIAYLDDEAIRVEMPAFPGWREVAAQRNRGEKLKDAAARLGGRHFGRKLVDRIASTMRETSTPAPGDLPHRVADVVSASERETERA